MTDEEIKRLQEILAANRDLGFDSEQARKAAMESVKKREL